MIVKAIHQVEITSRCNLACKYCAHPKMKRPKEDMDEDTYLATLDLTQYLQRQNGEHGEFNLAGIGESTMHPDFNYYVSQARRYLGWRIDLILATNGVSLTEEHAACLEEHRVKVWVSLHRPEKGGPAVELLKKHHVLCGVSIDSSVAAVNWAGQVRWHVTAPHGTCNWLRDGLAFVMSNGSIATCCFDAQGTDGVIGHVRDYDPTRALEIKPYSLCKGCHLNVPAEQRRGDVINVAF